MKKVILYCTFLILVFSCDETSKTEEAISKIDVNFNVERFDIAFAEANSGTLPQLKDAFPFLFSKQVPDSIWVNRINDTLQKELHNEVAMTFKDFTAVESDIEGLFQHLKYYDNTFTAPRVVTLTSDVDYRNKVIVTDTIMLIALDTYLGENHKYYQDIPRYITQNMTTKHIVSDLATEYSKKYIYQSKKKTLLDEMVYFGKQLYFKDAVIPFKTDAEKIGYTQEQLDWSLTNEQYIWEYFVENKLLYSTDPDLPNRFIAGAPFSKFYLELDRDSPGRLGQYIGWQIVRAYMENNNTTLQNMMQMDALEIFNNSRFKPKK
ncbi:gliding motility lipoprotein GldB [Lacinutrix undariae]